MAQFTAGETITFEIDGVTLTVKIEDASKSDMFSGKVTDISSNTSPYHVDQVYEFDRKLVIR